MILQIFQFLCTTFFNNLTYLRAKNLFREYVSCIISFCDIDIEKTPRSAISIDFPWFWNSVFSKNTGSNLINVWFGCFPLVEKAFIEEVSISSFHQSPHSQKNQKLFNVIDLFGKSNLYFSVTSDMISPSKVSIMYFPFKKDESFNIFLCFDPCSRFVTVHIFHEELFFDRYSNSQFSATTSWISSIKISIENTALVGEHSTRRSLSFSFPSESWWFENSKKTFYFFPSIFKLIDHQNCKRYFFHQGRQ